MGRSDQRFTHLRKKVFGRCPPCLLSHTTRPANPVIGVRPPHRSPPRRKPISAPTNGWSRSCTSVTSPTLDPLTGPGGVSSPTTSPRCPTGRAPSRSSAASPPLPRRPLRLRRGRPRRRALRPHPLPRLSRHAPLPRAQRYLLPRAQL